MAKEKFDFGGWATKNDLLCADGRTIRRDAFKDDDGRTVPLVWQHNHDDPTRVIGHAMLENRNEGVYAYCSFNNSDLGQHVKELVSHGDVRSLSIYANQLKQRGGDVIHGIIREVSVVLAGANPGAVIEFPMLAHGEESTDEAVIWTGDEELSMGIEDEEEEVVSHAEPEEKKEPEKKEPEKEEKPASKSEKEETVQDVLDTLNEKQMKVVEYLIGKAISGDEAEHDAFDEDDEALEHADDEDDGETVQDVLDTLSEKQMKVVQFLVGQALEEAEKNKGSEKEEPEEKEAAHSIDYEGEEMTMNKNVFDNEAMNAQEENVLTHAQMDTIIKDGKRLGSLKASVLEHSAEYGIDQIDYIMPEYKEASGNGAPQFIKRDQKWVAKVMQGVHHIPFSKFKTTFADITEDEARARGYITGSRKKEEVFGLLRRTTDATTVYKKQKLDRDNAVEITSFDVVAWLKGEMRMMLDEELARAFLIGDGRDASSEDKINELNIRPVLKDDDLFVIRQVIEPEEGQAKADAVIDAATYGWENYQGSGDCIAFMTRRTHSQFKLLKDKIGHRLYKTDAEIASALGVKEIAFVPQMGDASTVYTKDGKTYQPAVIILDLGDYTVGADKGGAVNMFDDFDIDYNQMKYLIETRCSGALVKPYSAIVVAEEVNP